MEVIANFYPGTQLLITAHGFGRREREGCDYVLIDSRDCPRIWDLGDGQGSGRNQSRENRVSPKKI